MATIEFKGFEEYEKKIEELGAKTTGIIKYAVYDAAGMVADAIKANTPVSEGGGDLRDSVKLTHFRDEEGFIYTKVIFDGYDRNGVPNQLKANVLESGRSDKHKHTFIRPATDRVKKAAKAKIEQNLDKKIEQIMNK